MATRSHRSDVDPGKQSGGLAGGSLAGTGPTAERSGDRPVDAKARSTLHGIALFVLSLCYSAALFQRLAFQGLAPVLGAELGLDFRLIADLGAAFFWAYLALMLPSGVLVDVFGARRVASVAALVSGLGCALLSAADSARAVFDARIVISVGGAFAFVCMMRFVLVAFPQRKASVGGRAIFVGNLGAIAAGAPLSAVLVLLSWRQVWAALAIGWLLLALAIRLLAPADRPVVGVRSVIRGSARSIADTLRCPRVWLGATILAGLAGTHWAGANLIGPVVLSRSGFDPIDVGAAISFLVGGYAIGAVAWGWLGDRFANEFARERLEPEPSFGDGSGHCGGPPIPAEALVFCASAVAASAWLAIASTSSPSLPLAMLLLFVAGFSAGAFGLVYGAIAAFHPAGRSGVVVAAVNCGIPFGAASIQAIAGRLSPSAVMLPVLVGVMVSLFGALLLWAIRAEPRAR